MESLLPASLQGFAPLLLLAGLIAGPKVIRRAREVRQRFALARAAAAQQDPEASRAAFQRLAGVTVLALALSVALIRFCRPSQDIFADNGLSILGSPTSHLAYLLRREPARDPLINLLNSRSGRSTYARFGHDAAMSCSWCAGDDDRWIASAPGTVGFWLASLAVLAASSFGGMGGGRTARKIATWTCTSAALVELWARSDWGPGTWRPGPGEDLVPVSTGLLEAACFVSTDLPTRRSTVMCTLEGMCSSQWSSSMHASFTCRLHHHPWPTRPPRNSPPKSSSRSTRRQAHKPTCAPSERPNYANRSFVNFSRELERSRPR